MTPEEAYQEALRRIRKAEETRALELDLLQRTEWNVRDSVLFSLASELTGGSKKTVEFAKKHS